MKQWIILFNIKIKMKIIIAIIKQYLLMRLNWLLTKKISYIFYLILIRHIIKMMAIIKNININK